ncbi:hypothetical protein QN239_20155 [Mycolicibacterium sp. Y3]
MSAVEGRWEIADPWIALAAAGCSMTVPLWFGAACAAGRPIDRAARNDGIFPFGADAAKVARIAESVGQALHAFWPGHRPDQVLRVIGRGAPG